VILDVIRTKSGTSLPVIESDINPYSAPAAQLAPHETTKVCNRRLDVAVIALVLSTGFVLSIVAWFVPQLRDVLNPRFGVTLTFIGFPVVHLCMFLWRPNTRMLWFSAGMTLFVGIAGGLLTWQRGTVTAVSHPYNDHDLMHSAYLFSTIPALVVSCYLASVAWRLRSAKPMYSVTTTDNEKMHPSCRSGVS